jgi:hypothetical protein
MVVVAKFDSPASSVFPVKRRERKIDLVCAIHKNKRRQIGRDPKQFNHGNCVKPGTAKIVYPINAL